MEIWFVLLFVAITINVRISHAQQLNYVKPHDNTTCPGDPCLTFQAYSEAVDTYFVSDTDFVFISGDHNYPANLRLTNVTNMHFRTEKLSTVHITFNLLSNMTFITSYNITFSDLSFTLGGSPTGNTQNGFFAAMDFRNSTVRLSNLTFIGSRSSVLFSTALFCRSIDIEVTDIHIVGAKSVIGAGLFVYNSTVSFSGNNTYINNYASIGPGVILSLDCNMTFSGVNHFEGNQAIYGGAIYAQSNSNMYFNGTVRFLRNRANFLNGGAIGVDNSTLILSSSGEYYFFDNYARLIGGALYFNDYATGLLMGQITVQRNTASHGAIGLAAFSNVTIRGDQVLLSDNTAHVGAAVSLLSGSQMLLSRVTVRKNSALFSGGGLAILLSSHMVIEDSYLIENNASMAGAMKLGTAASVRLIGSNYIEDNHSDTISGGIDVFNSSRLILTGNVTFRNNTARSFGGVLSLTLSNASIEGNISFMDNHGLQGGAVYGVLSTLDFDKIANVTFENNRAVLQGGSIYSVDTTWNMKGNIKFINNSAPTGGAMSMVGSTKLIINKYSNVTFMDNYAEEKGGALFFADAISINQCQVTMEMNKVVSFCYHPNTTILELCRRLSDCFLELNTNIPFNASTSNINLSFINNFAGKSGSVIFGGSLDNCRLYLGGGFKDSCGNKLGRYYSETPLQIFQKITVIDNQTSAISSEPFRMCFCDKGVPNCDKNLMVATVRGKEFTLSAVAVGQGNYTVASSIKVDFINSPGTEISPLQRTQDTGNTCTDIVYRVFSTDNYVTMILFPDGPCRDTGIARREVQITFLPCPDGLIEVGSGCSCDKRLSAFNTTCNVDNGSIDRVKNNFWMKALYDNSSYLGLLIHESRCPFDFCVETAIEIQLDNPDIQCNHNHSGIVCGSCRENFSLAFGSLHCLPCSNAYLSLILPFAVAGIALVVFLLLLQLTVAIGTMNGLIFYVNVVQVNRDIFFPPGETNILTIFIAWLNLDLGIETCFYNGMNTNAFMWLQFAFPFYVWFLIAFIIFLSHYSKFIAKCFGSNPVSVLATLILLSYSKILRTIISVLSRTSIHYPDGMAQYVWLYDGNVPYFQRADHIVLGVFAICVLFLLFLPYTFLLLCGNWIQAYSHWKIFSWINKIKPLMDAYYAPYKKESRYWTGFLLLVRCALFLTFAFNALGNTSINFLTITSVTVGLTVIAWLKTRLYEKIFNDFLEACFVINLCILAAATYHVREIEGSQDKLAFTSVGIAFVIFIGIVLYHVYRRICKTSFWKRLPKPDHWYYMIRFFSHTEDEHKDEGNGEESNSPVRDNLGEIMQAPTTTTIELREPLIG